MSATTMLGPSSSKFRACPMFRKSEPKLWSPSLSVIVSVRVSTIRSAAASVFESSGLAAFGCTIARCWSSVTVPVALTLTVNTTSPVADAAASVPSRPSTTPEALRNRNTLLPVATSSSPESAPLVFRLSA
ncbi:hypothetical protein D9M72_467320 [compost metagenome]